MKKFMKIAALVLIAAIFIGTFVFLYQKSQPEEVSYQILKAETKDLVQTTVATGKIEPRDEVEIKPQISGIIAEVYKEAGQTVQEGEVIAKVKVIPELGTLNSEQRRIRTDASCRQASPRRTSGSKRQPGDCKGRYHQEQRIVQQHPDTFHHYRTDTGCPHQSRKFRHHEQYIQ